MPIGIVNKDDYKKETANNPIGMSPVVENSGARPIAIIESKGVPAGRGTREVPEAIRNVIAQEMILGGSRKEVGAIFGVSEQTTAAYKMGTRTLEKPGHDKKLKSKNQIFRDTIIRKASRLSLKSINAINDEEVEAASVMEKASIAKTMASIVKDMTPIESSDNDSSTNVQVIIHAPAIRAEKDYYDGQIISQD